jgi:hypothetical protein
VPSPQPLRCEFRLVAKGAGFCTPGGPRAPAGPMPPRCLWMWQLSASAVKGGTEVFSSMRKRAGGGLRLRAPLLPAGKAQQVSARAAGHPSSASSLESRRGGEQACSAASSITAKKRPPFLQTPPLLPQTALLPACDGLQRRLRNPPVPLAADIAPLRALPPGRPRRGRRSGF